MYLQTTETSESHGQIDWLAGDPVATLRTARSITIDIADFQTQAAVSGLAVSWKDEAAGIVEPDTGVAGAAAGYLIDPVNYPSELTTGFAHGNLMTRGAVVEARLPVAPSAAFKTDMGLIEHRSY